MSEELLIRHCAPTLAGIKTGNMFTCPYSSREEVLENIRALNRTLGGKGIRVLPLQYQCERVLIYVYRPKKLLSDLENSQVRRMLAEMGYSIKEPGRCLRQLMARLRDGGKFPHEIGLFLGYPPEDVAGFMENAACGYKCVGCWKVYGDAGKAEAAFRRFKKCSKVYYDQWRGGTSIERLTVAV